MKEDRILLLPVEDSEDSQRAFDFMLKNIYREGDEIHLLNVIPRIQFAATMGVPAVDFTPQINREAYESVVQTSETFIVKRFLSRLPEAIETTPIVHIIKSEVDTESLGHIVCEKAEELKATLVIMGNHGKGKVAEFFRGSVSQYVAHTCKRPFLLVRGGPL
ncbi:MAG: hypothetical protein WDW36_009258 [Sanguina aurantia]